MYYSICAKYYAETFWCLKEAKKINTPYFCINKKRFCCFLTLLYAYFFFSSSPFHLFNSDALVINQSIFIPNEHKILHSIYSKRSDNKSIYNHRNSPWREFLVIVATVLFSSSNRHQRCYRRWWWRRRSLSLLVFDADHLTFPFQFLINGYVFFGTNEERRPILEGW